MAVAAWVLILVVAAVYAALYGRPTVRTQTTVVDALPTVDRVLGFVAAAATGPQTVAAVSGYERAQPSCSAGNRRGERYERSITVFVAPGAEGDLVDRVAGALPAAYHPTVRHLGELHTLRADAGFYVGVTGGVTRSGRLRFVADTGCRVRGGAVPVGTESASAPAGAPLSTVLAALHATPTRTTVQHLRCPAGGSVSTTSVQVGRPAVALTGAAPAAASVVVARDDVLAYTAGGVGVAVSVTGDGARVEVTTGCQ